MLDCSYYSLCMGCSRKQSLDSFQDVTKKYNVHHCTKSETCRAFMSHLLNTNSLNLKLLHKRNSVASSTSNDKNLSAIKHYKSHNTHNFISTPTLIKVKHSQKSTHKLKYTQKQSITSPEF